MRAAWLLGVLAGCGRLGFGLGDDGDVDAATDAPEQTVLVDFSGLLPYDPNDFVDGGMASDNGMRAIGAMYAPFPDGFAVLAGRSLLELRSDGTNVRHDYAPAAPDMAGPDNLEGVVFGVVGGVAALWLGSQSQLGGDGVYEVTPTWTISREENNNNTADVAVDPTGAFDARGTPTLYYVSGNAGLMRRDARLTFTVIAPFSADVNGIALTPSAIYVVESDAAPGDMRMWRVDSVGHTVTKIDEAPTIDLADGGPATDVIGVRDQHEVVQYTPDGTRTVLATSPDLDSKWIGISIPRAPHPLAGRMIVLETNRVLDRDRLVLLPP